MPSACLLISPEAGNTYGWCHAFGDGLKRHGWDVVVQPNYEPCDMVVTWGVRRWQRLRDKNRVRKSGRQVCILERGYLGDRFHFSSVSFGGGLNGHGEFTGPAGEPGRWNRLFAHLMQPWRAHEGYVLITGQVATDASVVGVDLPKFYAEARAHYAAQGLQVVFREHPNAANRNRPQPPPIVQALADARQVVTWNSNSAVDAVVAGVPVVAMDRGTMAWPVCGHGLAEAAPRPDREDWARDLAWCQFSQEEMASGFCWDAVGKVFAPA